MRWWRSLKRILGILNTQDIAADAISPVHAASILRHVIGEKPDGCARFAMLLKEVFMIKGWHGWSVHATAVEPLPPYTNKAGEIVTVYPGHRMIMWKDGDEQWWVADNYGQACLQNANESVIDWIEEKAGYVSKVTEFGAF